MSRFEIGAEDFLLDGRPYRILSGAMHYFRIHEDDWAARIDTAKAMGLNTIETYVAWNAHAPHRGEFDLTGRLDLGRYLDLVHEAGMTAIVRPGPYICAEWDNGGLPGWLFSDGAQAIRCSDPAFLEATFDYFRELAAVLAPRLIDNGGPVILLQVENEYGAYGTDQDYLRWISDAYLQLGLTVPQVTVDQPEPRMLHHGGLPDVLRTGSFGSRVLERLATLREYQPTGPLMCMEFWNGWFDHWGEHHHIREATDIATDLDTLLTAGASVNVYMAHGGTNFGLTNGANDKGTYASLVTSYDYDAPIDELGRPTEKFEAFRKVLAKHGASTRPLSAVHPYPELEVELDRELGLWDAVAGLEVQTIRHAPSMDDMAQYRGLALYRCELPARQDSSQLEVAEVRDRAWVFLDDTSIGVISRDHHQRTIALPPGPACELRILVEDCGRTNYGPKLGEEKGLIGPVTLDGSPVLGWRYSSVPLEDPEWISACVSQSRARGFVRRAGPHFAVGRFELPSGRDLLLDTGGWGKGLAWVNGFCLGRFWSRGPQQTLVVPGGVVSRSNELVVLELDGSSSGARFVSDLRLGHTEA